MGALRYALKCLVRPVYWLTHAFPRSPDLWVFGAWFGQRFSDNPKYLYRYLRRVVPEVKAVWICANRRVRDEVRRQGGAAALWWSLRGLWWQLRAGVVVVCVGVDDVAGTLTGGALVINLWHGIPLKRIGADDDRFSATEKGLLSAIWWIRNRLILAEWRRYRAMPTTSPEVQERFAQAFRLPPDRTPVLGFPRNDVLLSNGEAEVRAALGALCGPVLGAQTRIVAYLPTHRQEGRGRVALFPLTGFDPQSLDALLVRHDAVVVYKGHFYQREQQEPGPGTRFVDLTSTLSDVQMLLAAADVLLTDLSSCYFDFLLRDRPMVFLRGTIGDYVETERGLYYDYESVTPGAHVGSHAEFLGALDRALTSPTDGASERRAVLHRFHTFCDNQSSARVYAHIEALARRRWPKWRRSTRDVKATDR